MSGADIAREVSAAIAEAGAATGDGTPLQGTILRPGEADTTTYPPTPGVEQEYACHVLLTQYSVLDRQGTNIGETDLKAMIAPDAETDPRNGDKLRVAGTEYSLRNVSPYKPGGTVLYWTATAGGS